MTGNAGFDRSDPPTLDVARSLFTGSNLRWCVVYLPSPSHGNAAWLEPGLLEGLKAQGWGFAFVFVGQEQIGPGAHNVNGPQGRADGAAAAAIMRGLVVRGVAAPGAYVYFDNEGFERVVSPLSDYFAGLAFGLEAAGFGVGFYCAHAMAPAVVADVVGQGLNAPRIYAVRVPGVAAHPVGGVVFPSPDPGGSGYPGATAWQLDEEARLTAFGGFACDLDTARTANPSAP